MITAEWLSKVLQDDALTTTQRAVAASLWSFMDRAGKCNPSVEVIGRRAGLTKRRSIRLAIDVLTERGWVERVLQPDGRLSPNRYRAVDNPQRRSPKGTATVVPFGTVRGVPKGTPQGGSPKDPRTYPEELTRASSPPARDDNPWVKHLANHTRLP